MRRYRLLFALGGVEADESRNPVFNAISYPVDPAFEECRIRLVTSKLLKSSRIKQNALRRAFLRAAFCALLLHEPGGANRDRTGDLLLAKQALSQLSYGPAGGTLDGKSVRSEAGLGWWVWMDSNHRPPPYQDDALTN